MKKHTEKQPIDDLFARKLSNMSMPPSSNGFERLQARMGQNKPEARIMVWRNPFVQRYMAIAACLLIVCLFGWLYLSSNNVTTSNSPAVAVKQARPTQQPANSDNERSQPASVADNDVSYPIAHVVPNRPENKEQIGKVGKSNEVGKDIHTSTNRLADSHKTTLKPSIAPVSDEPVLAQIKAADSQPKPETTEVGKNATNQPTVEQVADVKPVTKPISPAERVLVVTIDEPTSLVAARQAAKTSIEDKPVVAVNDKLEKDAKAGGLWAQVKRIKHGELFAKRDNASEEDRGLLDRAYNGLKRSLDKDKSAKQ
ncbi:hypothetical protein [Spirosoma sp. KNUC1025]|uniref:hypothetical protein n=1 Tax=Spirosoma sp. KNUC1025 TaxID=2894082 RepID=UPI003864208C|nr:hypothetical protein LN737_05440 [Spirosoma sp. KNUC1025]